MSVVTAAAVVPTEVAVAEVEAARVAAAVLVQRSRPVDTVRATAAEDRTEGLPAAGRNFPMLYLNSIGRSVSIYQLTDVSGTVDKIYSIS